MCRHIWVAERSMARSNHDLWRRPLHGCTGRSAYAQHPPLSTPGRECCTGHMGACKASSSNDCAC